jgi:hypothetical protein
MDEEEREDYEVAKAAAEIARKIQELADKDSFEYAAIIFRDATGAIAYTPVVRGTASSVPNFYTDNPDVDWGSVLGVVHSHPSILFNETMPEFRLYPTPNGDWEFFVGVQTMIVDDLRASGYSEAAAQAQADKLVQFIYGATTDAHGNSIYRLFRYDSSDKENQLTGDDQLNHAEEVSLTLGTCGG